MRLILFLTLLLVCPVMGGCGLLSNGSGDRWEAVKEIRQAEEATKQEYLRTRAAEFVAHKEQGATLAITTMDSAGRPVVVSMDLAPVIRAAVGPNSNDMYGVAIANTELPDGAVAESIRAFGGAAKDILSTPTATAFAVGSVINGALSETGGGGTHINGDTINTDDSFNDTNVYATGSGNTASASGRQESQETTVVAGEGDVDG